MNNHRLLTGLLAAALLGGACAAGQTKRVFTMEELFDIAESNSIQLKPAMAAEREARESVRVARNGRLPDINANLSMSFIGNGFTLKRDFTDYQRAPIPHLGNTLAVSVTQPVYTGGAVTASIELAELKSTAARYTTELERDNIRFRVAGSYLDIYKCSNLRGVVESNITQARRVLQDMKERHAQGVALLNDITRYELLVSNLELQLVKLTNTLDILNHDLTETVGLEPGTEVVPDSTILSRTLPQQGESQWQQIAAEMSPGIRLAHKGLEISRKAEALALSERLPKIGLQAAWNFDGPILTEVPPINRNLSYWYVGVGINYSLSSLFKTNKSVARSREATREAADRLAATRQDVSLAVRSDYVRYLEAYEELRTQLKSVELAERNYAVTSTRYAEGMALITDMLDAANSKLDAEQKLVNARIDIIYYYYKLLFISGQI